MALTHDLEGNTYAVGRIGGIQRIVGAWSPLPARGISIAATHPDDIWVAGGPEEVNHWNGTFWSRLGVTGAVSPRVVATPTAVYLGGTTETVLLR